MTIKTNRFRMGLTSLAVAMLAVSQTACIDELLEVTDPDTVNPTTLERPDVIETVIAGGNSDFAVAYSGAGGDAFLSTTALLSDEFFSTGTFSTRTATDRRIQQTPANGNTSDGAYTNLQQARRALRLAAEKVAAHPDKGTGHPDYAEMTALWGYTYVALGEGYCSNVPISNDEQFDPSDGPPRTSMALFNEAVPIFASVSSDLASVGQARALVNAGDYAAAAAAVTGVPTSFNYFIEHSDNAANNPFFSLQSNGRYSVSHNEGGNGNGLPFRGATPTDNSGQDPRVPWFEDPAGGFDPVFPLYVSNKYPTRASSVVLASGIEARLIEAENQLATGGDWLGTLNTLRANVGTLMAAQIQNYATAVPSPTLAPLTDPGTDAARVDLLFSERAMWLYGTGHRLGDMRRLLNQYGRTEATVYPSGAYHKGGTHGADVVFPLDFDEINNQLYDPALCNVASASFN